MAGEISFDVLEKMLSAMGPSGYEEETVAVWRRAAEQFADEVDVDLHGNARAVVNKGAPVRVMLAGHVDEIGFQVSHIDENGYLYFANIGGWDAQVPVGQRVWIRTKTGRVTGVIGKRPIHVIKPDDRKTVEPLEKLWIDIGVGDGDEVKRRVAIGDPVVLAWGWERLSDDYITSRGIDDKTGAFVCLEAARLAAGLHPKAEIHCVATVQEEIGTRGAITSAFGVDPHAAVAVDVTNATDYPGMDDERRRTGEVALGKGPVVVRGANINPALFDHVMAVAEREAIPTQVRAIPGVTGTDARSIQLARGGVATSLVSIPNRYMHSPCEIVNLKDVEYAARLIGTAIAEVESAGQFRPW